MSISPAGNPYVEFTPQVMAAKQAAQTQQIGIAVAKKLMDVNAAQGAQLLQQLQSTAALDQGLGRNLDMYA